MATVKNSIILGFDLELAFIKLLTMTNMSSFDLSPLQSIINGIRKAKITTNCLLTKPNSL